MLTFDFLNKKQNFKILKSILRLGMVLALIKYETWSTTKEKEV